ncbi:MAG: MurR/RpiR family transcriptional regulator [Alphaproteobacteria bacterium]|nr:MurR/RpiR family transcriptional regulator [Alphaproteobacteria bacterium]
MQTKIQANRAEGEETRDTRRGHAAIDLISNLQRLSFGEREQRVADYVGAHLERVSEMTIGELSSVCGVSAPTVVRFCRTMGCDGFREFKLRLAQNLAVSLQYLEVSPERAAASEEQAIDSILGALYATANIMRRQVRPEALARARDVLAGAERIVSAGVGGGSSIVAEEAASRFFRLGKSSVAVSDGYLLQMRAATLGAGDALLLVSASGEAEELVSAAEIAGGYGATTICVTRPGTRLAEVAAIGLLAELPEDPDIYKPTASRYAHLIIVDALALLVARLLSEETTENLRRIRASLTAYHGRTGPQPLGD